MIEYSPSASVEEMLADVRHNQWESPTSNEGESK